MLCLMEREVNGTVATKAMHNCLGIHYHTNPNSAIQKYFLSKVNITFQW